ncbi:MAG: lipoyl synthase [Candidatus Omnitrophota bacterium]
MVQKQQAWPVRSIKAGNVNSRLTRRILHELGINTVCDRARCPNLPECFANKTATFLILGNVCTRKCSFCAVSKGMPQDLDALEPLNIAVAVKRLNLDYIVITSVTRDDLADGGAGHFLSVVQQIRSHTPNTRIELLIPDFKGEERAMDKIIRTSIDVFGHNIETVPRLYKEIRPGANYQVSLKALRYLKRNTNTLTKCGLMLGLGEKFSEVIDVLKDLRRVNCDIITLGQYLCPGRDNLKTCEYIQPEMFKCYEQQAKAMGFRFVKAGPFVRSSYHAREVVMEKAEPRMAQKEGSVLPRIAHKKT